MPKDMKKLFRIGCCLLLVLTAFTHNAQAQDGGGAPSRPAKPAPKPEYPPYTDVMKGYEQVISTIDKSPTLFGLFVNRKDNQAKRITQPFED